MLDFFCARFPHVSRALWTARFERGDIRDAQSNHALDATEICAIGTKISYARETEDESHIPFYETVVFEDEHLVVADKPHFLPVAPVGRYVRETLLTRLIETTQCATLAPLHRIDQDTAGLVVFSKIPRERGRYQQLFATRAVDKIYEAIAPTLRVAPPPARQSLLIGVRLERSDAFMQARVIEGAPNTETNIEITAPAGTNSLYTLRPKTGARHQLRAVMAHLGAPILNDRIYPTLLPQLRIEDFAHTPPLQLLARAIAFTDPISNKTREFVSARMLALA